MKINVHKKKIIVITVIIGKALPHLSKFGQPLSISDALSIADLHSHTLSVKCLSACHVAMPCLMFSSCLEQHFEEHDVF